MGDGFPVLRNEAFRCRRTLAKGAAGPNRAAIPASLLDQDLGVPDGAEALSIE
jgi:hypothetical protein